MSTKANAKQGENVDDSTIRDKILHLLKIYPIISPTMLQGGLGPYMKPAQWRPILNILIDEGRVIETQKSMATHQDRYNTYTMLHLPETVVASDS